MKIFGKDPTNFRDELIPLFEAMKNGETIRSVTCMGGLNNKDNREADFKILDFQAEMYFISAKKNKDDECFDLVDTNKISFYMNWVIEFELY